MASLQDNSIPPSDCIVKISVIDTGARISGSNPAFFLEPIIPGFGRAGGSPSYGFLIEHQDVTGKPLKYIFDLSLPKDLEAITATTKNLSRRMNWDVTVPKDTRDVLEEHGIHANQINGIIWSHWHWDHAGDPTRFPPETELVVGPGFKENLLPGYPLNPGSGIREDAFCGRRTREIKFSHGIKLCGMSAFDFFGDGSFYLLETYGHTIGHMCGLARTTPDTFILMGGDACHHPSVLRPNKYSPLPDSITPNPLNSSLDPCPGAIFESLHPSYRKDQPFHTIPNLPDGGLNHSREAAVAVREKLIRLDANENVFTIIAHDGTIVDLLEYFPASANDWKAKGWGTAARWRFLRDWERAVKAQEEA